MQRAKNLSAAGTSNGCRQASLILTLIACVLMLAAACAAPAYAFADVGSKFSASLGTIGGNDVNMGASLEFKVLEEAQGDEPGTVQIGDGNATAIDKAYDGPLVVPELVTYDGRAYRVVNCASYSFRGSGITEITLPSTLQRIRQYAFYNCSSLKKLDFSDTPGLTVIEGHAFETSRGDGSLEHMRLPASLRSVGVYAFSGQPRLAEVQFEGDTLNSIGQFAFAHCTGLVRARIPILVAEANALGTYCFSNCASLEFVEFAGNVASLPDDQTGTHLFDDCTSLQTVVYRGKKVIPTSKAYGSSDDLYYGFTASSPTLYYTITYYASQEDALAGQGALGAVCVRSDTPLCSIVSGMERADGKGAVVYDGEAISPPEGFDSWCYEGVPAVTDAPDDSLYAYPISSTSFEYASAKLDEQSFFYTGTAVKPQPVVRDARGVALTLGADYTLAYERMNSQGQWEADDTCVDVGEMRVVVTGAGSYSGTMWVDYAIVHAQEGDTFARDGVTYVVTLPSDGAIPGEVSVGDGSRLAVPAHTDGELVLPAVVSPEGSSVSYRVTAVSAQAFGSDRAEDACVNLEGVIIPEGVVSLGTNAFGCCSKLKSVVLPASVRAVGTRAFQYCTKLSQVSFEGEEVQELGAYCFAYCTSLKQLSLPAIGVMGEGAFFQCTQLARVDFRGDVRQAGATQFEGCKRLMRVVYCVPAPWPGSFASSKPAVYGVATFADAEGTVLGRAVLKAGTPLPCVVPGMSKTYLLEGEVPAILEGYGSWGIAAAEGEEPPSTFEVSCVLTPSLVPAVQPEPEPEDPTQPDEPTQPEAPKGLADGKAAVGGEGASTAKYRVVSNEKGTVAYVSAKPASSRKSVTVPARVTLGGKTYKVVSVCKKAFAGTEAKTVKVKSKKITSFDGAFKASKVKKVVAPKAKKQAYENLLTKAKCGLAVKVTWK